MKKYVIYLSPLLFFLIALNIDFNVHQWKQNAVFHYDAFGYHNYSPALFLYNDITEYKYMDSIETKYKPTQGTMVKCALQKVNNSPFYCNKYPMGVSLFQLPFFSMAHIFTKTTHQSIPDGFSSPYQHAAVLSTLLFSFLGLIILAKFLSYYFSSVTIFVTISLIAFGTNFLHYATLDSGLSHNYLFFLYAAILLLTQQWYIKATYWQSIFMGIAIGLCAITRPIDILAFLIPLCWSSNQIYKLDYLKLHYKKIIVIILCVVFATMPQLLYWKYVTGNWIFYSYSEVDYFEFKRFRLLHGLFSYRKGWFLYTPIAFVSFVSMFLISKKSKLHFYKPVFWLFFIPMLYLVFSWHNWFYGWSFGCRAMIGTLPLLAIPLANFVTILIHKKKAIKVVGFSL